MKTLLLAQLARLQDALRVDRSESRLGAQAVRHAEYRRALQHLDTAFVATSSAESELADLRNLILTLKE